MFIQVPDSVNKSLKRGHVPRTQIHYPRYSFQNQVAVNAVWIGSANSGVHESRNVLVGGHDHCNCGVEQVRPAVGPGWIPWNPAMVPTHEQHRMCRELYSNLVCPQSAVTRESIVNQNRQNFFTIKEEVSADKEDECSEEDDIESIGSPRSLASSGSTSSRDDTLINLSSELLSSSRAQAPAAKPRSQQVNPWGKASYSDLITMAITSTDDNMMTLSDIYTWIVKNVPYFNDKGTYLSVQGWKVGLRQFGIM